MARVVRAIPKGHVLSYARLAVLIGLPGRARLMGKLLRSTPGKLPWWRVLRADRTLAEPVARAQKRHLLAEGVRVEGRRVARAHVLPVGDSRLVRALGRRG